MGLAVSQFIEPSAAALAELAASKEVAASLERASDLLAAALLGGGRVFFCGNGGSAAEASHLAAELTGRLVADRPPLAGIALSSDLSAVTAIGNDYGFDDIFARQLRGLARAGDVLVCLSTSGTSPNVLRAAQAARDLDVFVVAMVGPAASPLDELAEVQFHCPGSNSGIVQIGHLAIGHELLGQTETKIASSA